MVQERISKKQQRLIEILLEHQITEPNNYTCLKYSGGSNNGGSIFIAWIPYIYMQSKLFTIVVPYREDFEKEKIFSEDDRSELEILLFEVNQEMGINLSIQDLWEVYRKDFEGHTRVFNASEMPPDITLQLKMFRGVNRDDHEKGRAFCVEFSKIIPHLPTSHLVATAHLMKDLETRERNIDWLLADVKHEDFDTKDYISKVLDLAIMELKKRKIDFE